MDIFKKPIVTYIGMAIAIIAIIDGAIDILSWLDPDVAWGIAGVAGFGSVASLRAYLEIKGWKTYAATGLAIVFNLLPLIGVLTPEQAQLLSAAFAPVVAATMQQTASKLKATQ